MKLESLAALALLSGISSALAAPTTQPLIPVSQIPVPAVREVPAAPPSKVVILPFENLGDANHRDWVGRAVQESLSSEIARISGIYPISAPAPTTPVDTASARALAKTYGGDTVIFGSYQFVDDNIRFTAQIVNVATGKALGGLKVSGDLRDLFDMEDQLGAQTHRALRPPSALAAGAGAANDALIFGKQPPAATADVLSPPMTNQERYADAYDRYYYDRSGSDVGYPYPVSEDLDYGPVLGYGYGYGSGFYLNGPIVIISHGHHGHGIGGPGHSR